MALADDFRTNLNKGRGIDPRAQATLDAKKNSRENKEKEIKRKHAEREINSLKARLSVIDRELKRLSVSERRYTGDEHKAQEEYDREAKNVLKLTNELQVHSAKVKDLQQILNTKKISSSRNSSTGDFGRSAHEKEVQNLQSELTRIDQEITQLSSKKRTISIKISSVQNEIQKSMQMQTKMESISKNDENQLQDMMQKINSEETVMNQLKSRFSSAQNVLLNKQRELESVKNRKKGTVDASPSLQNYKQNIEQKIRELEKDL